MLRAFGAEGVRARLRDHVALAAELAGWIDAEPGWTRVAPQPFSTVAFRWSPLGVGPEALDTANRRILEWERVSLGHPPGWTDHPPDGDR